MVALVAFAVVRPRGVDTVALDAGVAHTLVIVCLEERHRDHGCRSVASLTMYTFN